MALNFRAGVDAGSQEHGFSKKNIIDGRVCVITTKFCVGFISSQYHIHCERVARWLKGHLKFSWLWSLNPITPLGYTSHTFLYNETHDICQAYAIWTIKCCAFESISVAVQARGTKLNMKADEQPYLAWTRYDHRQFAVPCIRERFVPIWCLWQDQGHLKLKLRHSHFSLDSTTQIFLAGKSQELDHDHHPWIQEKCQRWFAYVTKKGKQMNLKSMLMHRYQACATEIRSARTLLQRVNISTSLWRIACCSTRALSLKRLRRAQSSASS